MTDDCRYNKRYNKCTHSGDAAPYLIHDRVVDDADLHFLAYGESNAHSDVREAAGDIFSL